MQKAVLWKLDWKLINPCILPHIIWNTAHISSGSVIWFLWVWFNLSNGRNMMDHMLPLVDYEDAASSAGFWLFHFPQDNQSLLQMLSSNVLPLAVPGSAIILAKLATEARPACTERVMWAPFLSGRCFVGPSRQYRREMIFLSQLFRCTLTEITLPCSTLGQ